MRKADRRFNPLCCRCGRRRVDAPADTDCRVCSGVQKWKPKRRRVVR